MTLTGDRFDAREAADAGLLSAVVDDEAALDAWVADQTDALRAGRARRGAGDQGTPARSCPAVVGPRAWPQAARTSAELFAGAEAAEGMAAFLEKRRPAWDTTT